MRDTIKKNRSETDQEKIFAKDIPDKEWLSKIYQQSDGKMSQRP